MKMKKDRRWEGFVKVVGMLIFEDKVEWFG